MVQNDLQLLIQNAMKTFAKLTSGDPYHFDGWQTDQNGELCMYYKFRAKFDEKFYRKRLVVSEVCAALLSLQATGLFDRKSYNQFCPVSASSGPCGFAVLGGVFVSFAGVTYVGRAG